MGYWQSALYCIAVWSILRHSDQSRQWVWLNHYGNLKMDGMLTNVLACRIHRAICRDGLLRRCSPCKLLPLADLRETSQTRCTLFKIANCEWRNLPLRAQPYSNVVDRIQGVVLLAYFSQNVRRWSVTCYLQHSSQVVSSHPSSKNLCGIFWVEASHHPSFNFLRCEPSHDNFVAGIQGSRWFQVMVVSGLITTWRYLRTNLCEPFSNSGWLTYT